jgi:LuxR family maltose regulon positive regulatory protein
LALSELTRPGANSNANRERDIVASVSSAFLQERLVPELGGTDLFDFALTSSVLDPVAPDLAETLAEPTGQDAHQLLAALTAVGLLTSQIEDGRPVLRWPPAARAALYVEAQRRDPARVAALHRAAAEWYLTINRPAPAARHAIEAGDWAQLVRVIESHWGELVVNDRDLLKAAFAAAPATAIDTSLLCRLARCVAMNVPDDTVLDDLPMLPVEPDQLVQLGHDAAAPKQLELALAVIVALRVQGRLRRASEQASRLEILAETAVMAHTAAVSHRLPNVLLQAGVCHLHAGNLDNAQPSLLRAYDLVPADSTSYVAGDAAAKLALLMSMQGYTAHTELWLRRCESAPRKNGWHGSRIHSNVLMARAWTALDQLDLSTAAAVLNDVRNDLVQVRQGDWPVVAYVEALHSLHTGQAERALRDLLRAATVNQSLLERGGLADLLTGSMRAELLLALNRANQARVVLNGLPEHPLVRVARARLALLSDQPADTIGLANDYQWLNTAPPRLSTEMLVLKAIAHHRIGQGATATATLGNAVRAAKTNRLRRPFATVPRAELLDVAGGLPAEAVEFLLDPALAGAPTPFPDRVEVVALTERERLIVTELAAGRRAQEIATELYLSYNTVRTYLRQIYRKLGANSREQAVDQARAYGLLPRS